MANIFKTFWSGLKVLNGSRKEQEKWLNDNFPSVKVDESTKASDLNDIVHTAITSDVANMTVVGDVSVDSYSKAVGSVWSAVVASGVGEALSSVAEPVESSVSAEEKTLEQPVESVSSGSSSMVVPLITLVVSALASMFILAI